MYLNQTYLCTKFSVIRLGIATCGVNTYTYRHIHTHTYTHIHKHIRWRNITPMPLGLLAKKLQPKVGLAGYDMLFAYFVVEAKSEMSLWLNNYLDSTSIGFKDLGISAKGLSEGKIVVFNKMYHKN